MALQVRVWLSRLRLREIPGLHMVQRTDFPNLHRLLQTCIHPDPHPTNSKFSNCVCKKS